MLKRLIATMVCAAIAIACGIWIYGAYCDIQKTNEELYEKSAGYDWNEATESYEGTNLPAKSNVIAYYSILILSPEDELMQDAIKIFDNYGVSYTTNLSLFDAANRTNNGCKVIGCYESDAKKQTVGQISAGNEFYIAIGGNDSRDLYTATNTEAMCKVLKQYIDIGILESIE